MDTTPRAGDVGGLADHFLAEAREAVRLAQAHTADAVARFDAGAARAGFEAAKLARRAAIRARESASAARKFAILARDAGDKAPDPEEADQAYAAGVEAGEAALAARHYADRAELILPSPKARAVEEAVEAAARAYYGAQDLRRPADTELQASFRDSWDYGGVYPDVMADCRAAVRPLVLDALEAYRAASQ